MAGFRIVNRYIKRISKKKVAISSEIWHLSPMRYSFKYQFHSSRCDPNSNYNSNYRFADSAVSMADTARFCHTRFQFRSKQWKVIGIVGGGGADGGSRWGVQLGTPPMGSHRRNTRVALPRIATERSTSGICCCVAKGC